MGGQGEELDFEKFAHEDSVAASQYSTDDSSGQTDDSDIGTVRDSIANAMANGN